MKYITKIKIEINKNFPTSLISSAMVYYLTINVMQDDDEFDIEKINKFYDSIITYDDIQKDGTEYTYFVGTYDDTQIYLNTLNDIQTALDGNFKVHDIIEQDNTFYSIDFYTSSVFKPLIKKKPVLKDFIINNISKDVVLDKILAGHTINEFDKMILDR